MSKEKAAETPELRLVRVKELLHLPPKYVGRVREGADDHFRDLLLKYIPQFQGVLLSYSDLRLCSGEGARIMYDSPYMHLEVLVTLHLFCPRVHGHLVGIVNKVSQDHVGCIVYGLFNASIPAQQLRTRTAGGAASAGTTAVPLFDFDAEREEWWMVNATAGTAVPPVLRPGAVIRFQVTEIIQSAWDMLSMQGSLLGLGCGLLELKPYASALAAAAEWEEQAEAASASQDLAPAEEAYRRETAKRGSDDRGDEDGDEEEDVGTGEGSVRPPPYVAVAAAGAAAPTPATTAPNAKSKAITKPPQPPKSVEPDEASARASEGKEERKERKKAKKTKTEKSGKE